MRRYLFSLTLVCCLAHPLFAWDNTGHELVAGIAWDHMTSAAQQQAIALLQAAPPDACLLDLFPTDSRPLLERQREFFMLVATWPDHIRSVSKTGPHPVTPHCVTLSQPSWHFRDRFWEGVSGATDDTAPKDRPDILTPSVNAVERLLALRQTVACDPAPCGATDQRALQLAWILHLVGDIHQPLHTASRVTTFKGEQKGDTGGNHFLVTGNASNLHSFWDHIVDEANPPQAGEGSDTSIAYLDRVIKIIGKDHPLAAVSGQLASGDFDAWSQEGYASAKRAAYPTTLERGQAPSDDYQTMAFAIADEAIARGGYRLADLLEAILAAPPAPAPPAALVAPTAAVLTKTASGFPTITPLPDGVPVVHAAKGHRKGPRTIYPDAAVNPGAADPDITQENIATTICSVAWHGVNPWSGKDITGTGSLRPPSSYTTKLKIRQLANAGATVHQTAADLGGQTFDESKCVLHSDNRRCYEEDHIISLQNGGAPADPRNLYPEAYNTDVKGDIVGAHEKDKVENYVHNGICLDVPKAKFQGKAKPSKALTLEEGQRILAIDWYACYQALVAKKDCTPPPQ